MDKATARRLSRITTKLNNVVVFLREHNHLAEAISCLDVLTENDSSFEAGEYAYEYGLCYEKLGETERAKAYLQIAIRQNPAVTRFQDALSMITGETN